MAKYFSAFLHIYIVYGMDPAQLLQVVVKQVGKLYFRFTWSQTQRQFSHYAAHIQVFTVKLRLLEPLCKEFRSRSGPTSQVQITGSGSKLFDIVVFFL